MGKSRETRGCAASEEEAQTEEGTHHQGEEERRAGGKVDGWGALLYSRTDQ